MAGKRKKRRNRGKADRQPARLETASTAGFDYGPPQWNAGLTDPSFSQNFHDAETVGCSYGERYSPELKTVLPFVAFIAKNTEPLKAAFAQMRAWWEASGPDAVSVEILHYGVGYRLVVGPSYEHLRWRTVGIDHFYDPTLFGISFIKTIDSRNPMLEQLRQYASQAIAPIYFDGVMAVGEVGPKNPPTPDRLKPIQGLEPILLLKLPIYLTASECPSNSLISGVLGNRGQRKRSRRGSMPAEKPLEISRRRERRMRAAFPFTLHFLRTSSAGVDLLAKVSGEALARWQVEQALLNLVVESERRDVESAGRPADFHSALRGRFESEPSKLVLEHSVEAIKERALLDGRYLLAQVGATNPPRTLEDLQTQLRKRGFLAKADGA